MFEAIEETSNEDVRNEKSMVDIVLPRGNFLLGVHHYFILQPINLILCVLVLSPFGLKFQQAPLGLKTPISTRANRISTRRGSVPSHPLAASLHPIL